MNIVSLKRNLFKIYIPLDCWFSLHVLSASTALFLPGIITMATLLLFEMDSTDWSFEPSPNMEIVGTTEKKIVLCDICKGKNKKWY